MIFEPLFKPGDKVRRKKKHCNSVFFGKEKQIYIVEECTASRVILREMSKRGFDPLYFEKVSAMQKPGWL